MKGVRSGLVTGKSLEPRKRECRQNVRKMSRKNVRKMSKNCPEGCEPERLGEGSKIGKSPRVVRRGCKRSSGPTAQRSPKSLLHHVQPCFAPAQAQVAPVQEAVCSLGSKDLLPPLLTSFGDCPIFDPSPRHSGLRPEGLFARNSGAGNGCANFMGAWKKCILSAGKTHAPKIPRFRGGVFWVMGGGEVPILFLWARGFFLISSDFHIVGVEVGGGSQARKGT